MRFSLLVVTKSNLGETDMSGSAGQISIQVNASSHSSRPWAARLVKFWTMPMHIWATA